MLRSIRLAFCLCVLAIAMIMAGCGGAHAPNNVRQALTLSGVVRELGPGGVPQPAADAEVGVALDGKNPGEFAPQIYYSAKTDGLGRYSISLPNGFLYYVTATKESLRSSSVDLSITSDATQDFLLDRPMWDLSGKRPKTKNRR